MFHGSRSVQLTLPIPGSNSSNEKLVSGLKKITVIIDHGHKKRQHSAKHHQIFFHIKVASPCPLRPPVLLGMILVCGNPTSLNTARSMFGKYEVIRYQLFVDKYDNAVLNLLKVGRVPANCGSAISYLP